MGRKISKKTVLGGVLPALVLQYLSQTACQLQGGSRRPGARSPKVALKKGKIWGTHGINFDVDQSTIRPVSMGTLNMIVNVMKANPDLHFEVDGHTQ
jgi:outer membrane protein OmpA-like peptidoglycan-associated protein